ncbi:MAG: carboxypeptidase [Elusimicrobia bacterium HGW-Elusimicrobia-3]|nr:MAG: carboxypeptidase [Elusimicrobia bacterium HGW-Elusimicrobia-3]
MKKVLLTLLLPLLVTAAAAGPLDQLRRGLPLPAAPEPAQSSAAVSHLAGDDRYWVTVSADDKYDRTALLRAGLDIVEIEKGFVSGFIPRGALEQLAAKGFMVRSRLPIADYAAGHLRDFPAADAVYHNYSETEAELRALAAANPGEASLFSLGKTTEGREIWCLRLNNAEKGEAPSARPAVFFMGNHHGREHLTNEVALALARHLLANKADPAISKYLGTLDIYIAPLTNPDGAEYDIRTGKYRWHRKNTRINADRSVGVDLNRNYDSLWCTAGASQYPPADTYCGPYAFSEPETRAIRDFVLARPNLKTLMSYHSYSSLLLYPWAGRDEDVSDARDRKVFETMARAMGALTAYRPQRASDLYVAAGDTGDWAYSARGIFAFTAELDGSTFYPGAAMIERASAKNIKAALYLLGVSDDPYKLAR